MSISPLAGKPAPASMLVKDREHLARIQAEAQALVARLFA